MDFSDDKLGTHLRRHFGWDSFANMKIAENNLPLFPGNSYPKDGGHWSKLAYLQHIGLPTELLDITRSPLIALYFSIDYDGNSHVSALFAINYPKITVLNQQLLRGAYQKNAIYHSPNTEDKSARDLSEAYNKGFTEDSHYFASLNLGVQLIIPIIAAENNIRMFSQQGLFLTTSERTATIEQYADSYGEDVIEKITFPSSLRKDIHLHLKRCGIKPSLLFHSQEGVVKEIIQTALLG